MLFSTYPSSDSVGRKSRTKFKPFAFPDTFFHIAMITSVYPRELLDSIFCSSFTSSLIRPHISHHAGFGQRLGTIRTWSRTMFATTLGSDDRPIQAKLLKVQERCCGYLELGSRCPPPWPYHGLVEVGCLIFCAIIILILYNIIMVAVAAYSLNVFQAVPLSYASCPLAAPFPLHRLINQREICSGSHYSVLTALGQLRSSVTSSASSSIDRRTCIYLAPSSLVTCPTLVTTRQCTIYLLHLPHRKERTIPLLHLLACALLKPRHG